MSRLLPPAAAPRFVDTSSGRLRVLHAGFAQAGGLPIVLIHGGGTDNSAISWYRLFEPLAAEREVWAIDLPGFGGSVGIPPVGGPENLARVVLETMEVLGVEHAAVAGISMGGDVALNAALMQPERVAGLVLFAPGGLVPRLPTRAAQRWAWRAAQLPDRILLPLTRLANRFVDTALRAIVKDPSNLPPEVVEAFVKEAREPRGSMGYLRYNQATLGRDGMLNDLSDRVHVITQPTLLMHGEDDPIVPPDGSRRAASRMPRAKLVMIPDCGHWVQLEAHEKVLPELQSFLRKLDPPR